MAERIAMALALLCAVAQGQQTIGRVTLKDAAVTGSLEVKDGQATLQGGASIVARDHTAELTLNRGGALEVCATSSLHVTSGAATGDLTPLLFALDRGALELRTLVGTRDVLITPDLRLSAETGGRVDLRVRVTSNGDTCVESTGMGAPTIDVVEQFGDGRYQVRGGQHVMFEHGSIREVVDKESSPCGCPPTPVMSLADRGATVGPGDAARAGSAVAAAPEQHPFPVAQSQGLTVEGPVKVPQAPPGEVHAQVSATMAYEAPAETVPSGTGTSAVAPAVAKATRSPAAVAKASASSSGAAAPSQPAPAPAPPQPAVAVAHAPAAPAPPGAHDLAHSIGHFFKRLFGRGKSKG